MNTTGHRAHSMPELTALLGKVFRPEEIAQGFDVQLRADDVVITPFAKSGTTWLQQMVHTLRTGGDMDFDDISRVIPWIETSAALDIDLEAEQVARPRAFKSHLPYHLIPKGGKYINAVRNPGDALYSMYKFMEGWFLEPGAVSLGDFAHQRFMESRDYWKHLLSWWPQRREDNVLFLAYEHMVQAPEQTIIRVADFIGVPLNDRLLQTALQHTSLTFMLEHKDRFDDAMMRQLSERRCKLPSGSDSAKVREGKIGSHREKLSTELIEALNAIWREEITATLGFKSYQTLIEALDQD
ncbi:MAG TPA: sulfotransferase [Porticoccaceae bacterium]|nr:sulfotransferase [Porticoccaceae bacterium]